MSRKIDLHPHREKIIEAIVGGKSLRVVAKMAGCSHTVIDKYKREIVIPAIETAKRLQKMKDLEASSPNGAQDLMPPVSLTQAVSVADPLLSRVEKRLSVLDRNIPKADEKEDFRGISSLMRADRDYLELHARLTGRLESGTVNKTAIIVCLGAPASETATAELPAIDVELVDPKR